MHMWPEGLCPSPKASFDRSSQEKTIRVAKAHVHWVSKDWKSVVFSDESKFNRFGSDGREWCWRKRGEDFDARYTKKVVKHGGGSVMVWCITATGPGRICRIEGHMDAKLYVEILQDDLLGTLSDLGMKKEDIYFQQDNDPKHTSKLASQWFSRNKLDKLDWPPQSPDMNIIEHMWHYLEHRVRTRTKLPSNVTELWDALVEEWAGIEDSYVTSLYDSMPERVQALLAAKGGHTKY